MRSQWSIRPAERDLSEVKSSLGGETTDMRWECSHPPPRCHDMTRQSPPSPPSFSERLFRLTRRWTAALGNSRVAQAQARRGRMEWKRKGSSCADRIRQSGKPDSRLWPGSSSLILRPGGSHVQCNAVWVWWMNTLAPSFGERASTWQPRRPARTAATLPRRRSVGGSDGACSLAREAAPEAPPYAVPGSGCSPALLYARMHVCLYVSDVCGRRSDAVGRLTPRAVPPARNRQRRYRLKPAS